MMPPDRAPLPPRWLAAWAAADPVPVTAAEVAAALALVAGGLVPADPVDIGRKLDATMQLWRLPVAWREVAEFYVEALEELPADLVDLALRRVRARHKYPEAPKPAEFVEAVRDDLAARKLAKLRLGRALSKARRDESTRRAVRGPVVAVDVAALVRAASKSDRTDFNQRGVR